MVTRRKTLQETSLDAKNGDLDGSVRANLDVYSKSEVDAISDSVDTLFDTTTTVATSGAQTLPAGPEGFITIQVNGVDKKIPYYGV